MFLGFPVLGFTLRSFRDNTNRQNAAQPMHQESDAEHQEADVKESKASTGREVGHSRPLGDGVAGFSKGLYRVGILGPTVPGLGFASLAFCLVCVSNLPLSVLRAGPSVSFDCFLPGLLGEGLATRARKKSEVGGRRWALPPTTKWRGSS